MKSYILFVFFSLLCWCDSNLIPFYYPAYVKRAAQKVTEKLKGRFFKRDHPTLPISNKTVIVARSLPNAETLSNGRSTASNNSNTELLTDNTNQSCTTFHTEKVSQKSIFSRLFGRQKMDGQSTLLWDDEFCSIWYLRLKPNESASFHDHKLPNVNIVISGSKLVFLDDKEKQLCRFAPSTGSVYHLAIEGGDIIGTTGKHKVRCPNAHRAKNIGQTDYIEYLIEKKLPAKVGDDDS